MQNVERKILVVEDESLLRNLIANLLESEGFLVQTAGSAVEAKRVAKLFDPDLALLDIELGDGPNGLDLAESLLALYPGLSVFFLTHIAEPRLVDRHKKGSLDSGPMLLLPFPETRCRYVRLVSLKNHDSKAIFGFAEIEILSDSRNVALGKPLRVAGAEVIRRSESATDGLNLLGRVLPLQQWVGELARRHDLERELPRVTRAIQSYYSRQKNQLVILGWLAGLALGGGLFAALLLQIVKMRQIATLRERFAAEIGRASCRERVCQYV